MVVVKSTVPVEDWFRVRLEPTCGVTDPVGPHNNNNPIYFSVLLVEHLLEIRYCYVDREDCS